MAWVHTSLSILLTLRNWNEAEIGLAMSIAAVSGILTETPAGALTDAIRSKRAAVVIAALAVTAGSLVLPLLSGFFAIALSQAAVSAASSIFGPAIAAISLGVVGHAHFAARTGRNEAFNHAGNAFAAAVAGGAAYWWGPSVVFGLIAAMAAASLSLGRIPGLRLDRAGIALTRAALMMAVGPIAPERCMSLSIHTAPIRQTRRSLQSANARTTCTEISAQNERYPLVCLYIAAVAGQLAAAA